MPLGVGWHKASDEHYGLGGEDLMAAGTGALRRKIGGD
jgi:hypothetical protein